MTLTGYEKYPYSGSTAASRMEHASRMQALDPFARNLSKGKRRSFSGLPACPTHSPGSSLQRYQASARKGMRGILGEGLLVTADGLLATAKTLLVHSHLGIDIAESLRVTL
jgi:hypothetical protein